MQKQHISTLAATHSLTRSLLIRCISSQLNTNGYRQTVNWIPLQTVFNIFYHFISFISLLGKKKLRYLVSINSMEVPWTSTAINVSIAAKANYLFCPFSREMWFKLFIIYNQLIWWAIHKKALFISNSRLSMASTSFFFCCSFSSISTAGIS